MFHKEIMPRRLSLEVWGELACFTRPEFKIERFSYPVITPSAARGIYDAIYCKPTEFRWQVTKVEVLTPPRYIALKRNEVKEKLPPTRTIHQWIEGEKPPQPIFADGMPDTLGTDLKGRTQRQTMALKNVHYRLHAYVLPWEGFAHRLPSLEAQFHRRASLGKCFFQPYLGCREFPAYFEIAETTALLKSPEPFDLDIGLMLYDVFDLSRPGKSLDTSNLERPCISLFHAKIEKGVMQIPNYTSDEVLKG